MEIGSTKWKTEHNIGSKKVLKHHSVESSLAIGNGFSTGIMSQSAMTISFTGLSLAFV